ncbi:hypothetical protein N9L66_00710 [Porticoccaceae bacterium]|nr:hypothetical protein [Porticoccaceae bacterium]MDA8663468.1 hypothetical protein [Porticoccaceae bacterium]MDA8788824.1 hypothetical protein [Porticoccaceae bacterium]MDB2343176.1 hypothetical protein [Porticoccaceae bacterium]MDB2664980.1 hypothetical protein [Porticoccaceae bacterium]
MGLTIANEGLVSDLGVNDAFRRLCSAQGATGFIYQGARLDLTDAADHNQMLPIVAAYAAFTADKSNLGADDIPVEFTEDSGSLTGVSCKFQFKKSSYPPSLMLTLLDYAVDKALEASNEPNIGNLDYLAAELQTNYDMEADVNAGL